jgi:hypothetical protein
MTREEAIRLMAVYEAMTSSLNPIFAQKLSNKVESERVIRAHGDVVMQIYEKCMQPIIKRYPDLDPDLERPRRKITATKTKLRR